MAIVVGATVGVTILCPGGMMLAVGVVLLVTGGVVILQDASKRIKQEPTRESNRRLHRAKNIRFSTAVFQEIKISLH